MSIIKGTGAGDQPSTGIYSNTIDQSLRFNNDDTPRLSRTWGAAATDDTTWTVSMWVKRASQDGGNWHTLFAEESEAWTVCAFYNDTLYIQINAGGGSHYIQTNRLFRDFSAWYHIVVAFDEDNGTAAHRLRLYINGTEETSFAADQRSSISSSSNSNWNTNGKSCAIGARSASNNSLNFDGYMAEFHNIDGQQLTPSSFGETKDGVWIPKAYSGSHGDNGFYLPFDDSSAIGDDESANTNDWTVANLAATDVVLDSPTNNFAIFNPLDVSGSVTSFFEGNLKVERSGNFAQAYSSFYFDSGKWYAEYLIDTGNADPGVIAGTTNAGANRYLGQDTFTYGMYRDGRKINSGSYTSYGSSYSVAADGSGDVVGIYIDADNGNIYFSINGTVQNSGTAAFTGVTGPFRFAADTENGGFVAVNFGQDDTFAGLKTSGSAAASDDNGVGKFYDTIGLSGYLAPCTSNLPDITIGPGQSSQADDNFNTVLYTGDGNDPHAITGVGFQPDWVWIKGRNTTYQHSLYDSVRGTNPNGGRLAIDQTTAENIAATNLKSFDSDGFTLSTKINSNQSSKTYVAWNWKAGGSASTNTDGSGIDSSVSANTDAGFSVLTYTGTGNTSHTIGHGLGKTPAFVMSKSRDTGSGAFSYWFVKWKGLTSNNNLVYFSDAQANIATNYAGGGWSDFDSSNTTTIVPRIGYTGSSVDSVNKSGEDYVAWVFAEIEGYSSIGSFTGNGADDGPFVYTGFRPAFVMSKRVDSAADWHIMDDKRNLFNVMDGLLFPSGTYAEASDAAYNRDFLSNGFKIRGSEAYVNASGGTFVYMAFAHSPFKFANAF